MRNGRSTIGNHKKKKKKKGLIDNGSLHSNKNNKNNNNNKTHNRSPSDVKGWAGKEDGDYLKEEDGKKNRSAQLSALCVCVCDILFFFFFLLLLRRPLY